MLASESILRSHHHHRNHHHLNQSQQQQQHTKQFNDSIYKQQVVHDAVDSNELARNTSVNAFNLSHPIVPSPTNVNARDNDIVNVKCKNSGALSTDENRATSTKQLHTLKDKTDKMNSNSINCLIVSHPNADSEKFIRECVGEIIKSAVFAGTNRSNKVVQWHSPEELRELFDFKLKNAGESKETLFDLLQKTIDFSVKTGHPYFINQLYSGLDPYALIGQWLTDALNPSVYTYEVAPVFTLMEDEVLSEMRRIVGFPNQGYGDGIFCPGGSIANGYAISCARFHKSPNSKKHGLFGSKRQIIFTSEDSHYSVEKLAMFMGMGSENVCKIKTNKFGKVDIENLEKQIKKCISENCEPMMISATSGTTVLGAFDDLNSVADLCKQYGMWMHVDAAWGGGALMSPKYRHLLNGIERADSVTWNPHKMLTASQQCSTFLTRHKDILSQCHSTNATYLFQKDKFYDTSYDTGDKHIQCGRRADVFKFWFMWKAKGTKGLEEHVNQLFKMSEFLTNQIRERSGFELVLENPECTNISFWYVPPSLRGMERNDKFHSELHKVAPKIKEAMIKKGSMMVTYQPLHNLPNFFRIVLQNSCLTESDMIYFLDEIETLGNNL
ncbi:cysteine sulfinic acid decarboxylase [Lucilia cuprina]|uniref:cysteine sulfinic acid decarboxylase n=1 Tax=Lucilia cuprina TaxID=7375 RepID=UPI001F06D82B|nr:cysteine sulfinic acid decarboxylase [Lucilia cuprina]